MCRIDRLDKFWVGAGILGDASFSYNGPTNLLRADRPSYTLQDHYQVSVVHYGIIQQSVGIIVVVVSLLITTDSI